MSNPLPPESTETPLPNPLDLARAESERTGEPLADILARRRKVRIEIGGTPPVPEDREEATEPDLNRIARNLGIIRGALYGPNPIDRDRDALDALAELKDALIWQRNRLIALQEAARGALSTLAAADLTAADQYRPLIDRARTTLRTALYPAAAHGHTEGPNG